MSVKISYEELFDVFDTINAVQNNVSDETKFKYAVAKNSKKFQKLLKKYNQQVFDINIKYAATYKEGDKKDTFIKDEKGNFTYTKEDGIKKEQEIRSLNETQVEIEPYYAELTEGLVEKLGEVAVEMLKGVIFKVEDNQKPQAE